LPVPTGPLGRNGFFARARESSPSAAGLMRIQHLVGSICYLRGWQQLIQFRA
jgi:hypothetical protein